MTPEEIEKAAIEFDKQNGENIYSESGLSILCMTSFEEGAKLADKKWQEKTRWIPFEERLPKVKSSSYRVLAREEDDVFTFWIIDSLAITQLKKIATHWRETEL